MSDNKSKSVQETNARPKLVFTGKGVAMILGTFVIIAAAVVAIVYFLGRPADTGDNPAPAGGRVLNEGNYKQIMSDLEEKVADGRFRTYMNTTWNFPDGNSPSSNAVMGNSPANNYPMYFTVTLTETSELVYTSGILPVGTEIDELLLDVPLSAGTYTARVAVTMIGDDGEPLDSNVGFAVTIVVRA